jgi:hypothetical protein
MKLFFHEILTVSGFLKLNPGIVIPLIELNSFNSPLKKFRVVHSDRPKHGYLNPLQPDSFKISFGVCLCSWNTKKNSDQLEWMTLYFTSD